MATKWRTMKDAGRDMHRDFATLAESLVDHHLEEDDGATCFNLHTYIESLTDRIDELLESAEAWGNERDKFALDAGEIARYLWACLAITHEGRAYPNKFRGMDVLD